MKIAHVTPRFPSLTQTFVAREIQAVIDAGHQVIVCQLRPRTAESSPSGIQVKGAQIIRWNWNVFALLIANLRTFVRHPLAYLSCLRDILGAILVPSRLHHLFYIFMVSTWLADWLRTEGIEHVHGHFLHSEAIGAMWLSRMLNVPFGITAHVVIIYHSRRLIYRAIRDAAFVVADTRQVLALLQSVRRDDLSGVHLIRNSIDLSEFKFRDLDVRDAANPPVILAVGRVKDSKGFDLLLRACHHLKQSGLQFVCRIVGDGPDRVRLNEMRKGLGLEHNVSMIGSLPFSRLREEYAHATVFVMPSKKSPRGTDGLPTVLIEAVAFGVPAVATRWVGIPDLIIDGETGLLAEPNDWESLAVKLEQLLADKTLQRRIALAGRAKIEREFDLRTNVSYLVSLMEKGAETHRTRRKLS